MTIKSDRLAPVTRCILLSVLVFAFLGAGCSHRFCASKSDQNAPTEARQGIRAPVSRNATGTGSEAARTYDTASWKLYVSSQLGFKIRYPGELLSISEDGDVLFLSHSIPFVHPDPCEFSDSAAAQLDYLTDFEVSLKLVSKDLKATASEDNDFLVRNGFLLDKGLRIEEGFLDEVAIGTLAGYRVTVGVEGCGEYTYYFPLNPGRTLLVKRSFITEFNPVIGDYREYLRLPGIIPPSDEEQLFSQILSSFGLLE